MNAGCPTSPVARASSFLRANVLACESVALRSPLLFAMLATLALLAAAAVVLRIGYETNDDVFLTMIVAGRGFCPRPDEHLIFSNVLLGHALKWLYESCPSVPWYGSYLLLTHYLAQVAILYCALTVNRDLTANAVIGPPTDIARRSFRRRLAMYLICFVLAEVVLLNNLQFTSTAFLAAQAGMFLLWLSTCRLANPRQGSAIAPLCAGTVLIVLAGLIRLESLIMAVAIATPLLAYSALRQTRQSLVFPAAAAGVACVLVLVATKYNAAYYSADPAWQHFYEFNKLRYKFNDYGWTSHTPETAQVFAAVGWSKNDHDMLARYYFDDAALYSEARMRAVLHAYPWKTARLTPSYFVEFLRRVARDRAIWSVILAMPFFLAASRNDPNARRVILACVAIGACLIAMLTLNNKVPPVRVYFPLIAFPLFATLLFPSSIASSQRLNHAVHGLRHWFRTWLMQPRSARTVAVMLVVAIVMGTFKQASRSTKNDRGRAAVERFVAEAQGQPQKLYVCWEAAFPFEFISPFDNLQSWSNVTTLVFSWMQRTPWTDEIKTRFHISDVAAAIYERDDVVLTATDEHKALFDKYVKEHYGDEVEFIATHDAGKRFIAGRFQQRMPPAETAAKRAESLRR